ncbi:MAG: metal ABC transporter permease [Candidatus Dadabacteria bacterium]|nr:metal ABC transporter permease [Candidatus Dadabacteria bacterium]
MSPEAEIRAVAALVSVSCAVIGTFLVLRGKAMTADSISHSILPGIVAGFLLTGSLSSPLIVPFVFAAALLSAFLSETLSRSRLMSADSSIAFVYPFLFSAGVILVSKYAGKAHLDVDSVLLGEIAFAPLDRLTWGGADLGPVSLYSAGAAALACLLFVSLFYKELKMSTFDETAARTAGLSGRVLSACFWAVVCFTCVSAFSAAGSVMLIALITTPPCCALLLTDRLSSALVLGAAFGAFAAFAGFEAAAHFNTNIAGAVVTVLGAVFLVVLAFAPKKGLVARALRRRAQRAEIKAALASARRGACV